MALTAFTTVWGPEGEGLYFDGLTIVSSVYTVPDPVPAGFGAADYAAGMAELMPIGEAWQLSEAAPLADLTAALAVEFARLDARAASLVEESEPRVASELLSDWERVLGLPDPCVTTFQGNQERRQAITGRLQPALSPSRAFFIALATALGYEITIDEFRSPAEADAAGISYTGEGWAHTWRVNVSSGTAIRSFNVGGGKVGEPLRTWGDEALECQFNRNKPAHTTVLFAYGV